MEKKVTKYGEKWLNEADQKKYSAAVEKVNAFKEEMVGIMSDCYFEETIAAIKVQAYSIICHLNLEEKDVRNTSSI